MSQCYLYIYMDVKYVEINQLLFSNVFKYCSFSSIEKIKIKKRKAISNVYKI